jgi:hypothetical protein
MNDWLITHNRGSMRYPARQTWDVAELVATFARMYGAEVRAYREWDANLNGDIVRLKKLRYLADESGQLGEIRSDGVPHTIGWWNK